MKRSGGFTLVEAVVLLAVVAVIAALVVTVMDSDDRPIHGPPHSSQLRGIHQGFVMFSQGNNGYFPGLDSAGNDVDTSVAARFELLVRGELISGDILIAPPESKTKGIRERGESPLTTDDYSYALLQLPSSGERRSEWRDTANDKAVVISDRAIADNRGGFHSIHKQPWFGKAEWTGYVVWNDCHVSVESTSVIPTQYGTSHHKADDLFKAAGTDDAYMIYEGK